jgi:ubiquinone/menaquinone biosynthesis C-methylase UbiE
MSENQYTLMQRSFYESQASNMSIGNHKEHNANPDYWSILLYPLSQGDWSNKTILDFGCGCGRSVVNVLEKYTVGRIDGSDIGSQNIEYSNKLLESTDYKNYKFYVTDGQSLNPAPSEEYDFIFSTIVLQHIPVYNIRRKILEDMYRCLKSEGEISIQMGYGDVSNPGLSEYYTNWTDAFGTNGQCDVEVSDEYQVIKDLTEIGFIDIDTVIRPSWSDEAHKQWIFFKATK